MAWLLRRLRMSLLTLWAASMIVFAVVEVLPGDPALVMLETGAREDTLAALRHQMGLDRSLVTRYLAWAGGLMVGDLGTSLTYDRAVMALVVERMAITLPLALGSAVLIFVIALPAGLLAAAHRGQLSDWLVIGLAQLGLAIPSFWLAILLILVFAVWLRWFPAGGFPGWGVGFWPALSALVLPALALALGQAAIMARVIRVAMLDAMAEDWTRTARSKGVGEVTILIGHVLPNALAPVLTLAGMVFAFLLSGALIVETVFYLPGLGRLLYQAVAQRDLIVVESVVMVLVAMVVVVNLLVDALAWWVDPRPHQIHED